MNRRVWYFFFFSFFSINPVWATVSTVESLFRNGSNPQIEPGTTAVFTLKIRQLQAGKGSDQLTKFSNKYYKFIITQDKSQRHTLLQMEYNQPTMSNSAIIRLDKKNSFLRRLMHQAGTSTEKSLFWATIDMLIFNSSRTMSAFLAKTNRDYQANSQVINQERLALYTSYKRHLQTIKDRPELRGQLISPLSPISQSDRAKVADILQTPFYTPTEKVSLVKEGDSFYILVKLEKTWAKFNNQNLHLVGLSHHDLQGDIELKAFDYKVFKQAHRAPRHIMFSFLQKKYHIQLLSLRYVVYRPRTLAKIEKSLRKAMKKNSSPNNTVHRLEFLP